MLVSSPTVGTVCDCREGSVCGIVWNVGNSLGAGEWESGTSVGTMDGSRYGSEDGSCRGQRDTTGSVVCKSLGTNC